MSNPDLVKTLRICERDQAVDRLMNDAADEIERLREENERAIGLLSCMHEWTGPFAHNGYTTASRRAWLKGFREDVKQLLETVQDPNQSQSTSHTTSETPSQEPTPNGEVDISVVDGKLVASVGVDRLAFAIENHPDNEASSDPIQVTDPHKFAEAIAKELSKDTNESGGTPFTEMLDEAAVKAVENACEGYRFKSR